MTFYDMFLYVTSQFALLQFAGSSLGYSLTRFRGNVRVMSYILKTFS